MVVTTDNLADLTLIGGRPCLDFVNTEGGARNGPPERIDGYGDLVAWSVYAGVVDTGAADRLDRVARARPADAAGVTERAVALREALYRIVTSARAGRTPEAAGLQVLNAELGASLSHRRLVPAGDGFAWRFKGIDQPDGASGVGIELDAPLWVIAGDAADLLTSDALGRVKECAGESCTWLFVDESRNRSRRWCDMGDCGNRAKARRYRERNS